MADVQQTYTFKFEFDRKDIKKQLKEISIDVKDAISQIGDASDKVVIFKELVSYLSNVDKALDAFKTKHKDDFSNLFGNPDKEILGVLTEIFNTTQQSAQAFATLKDKISAAESGKAELSTLRSIAEEINALFVSINKTPKIDINEMFSGKGSKAKGTDFAGRIKLLNDTLDEFGITYSGFQNKLKGGFGFGGTGGSSISKEMQREIDALNKQKSELQEIIDAVEGKDIKINISVKDDAKQIKNLLEEYKKINSKTISNEFKDLSLNDQNKLLAEQLRLATLLKNARDHINKNGGSDEAFDLVNTGEGMHIIDNIEKSLDGHRLEMQKKADQIKNIYADLIANIDVKLNQLSIDNLNIEPTRQSIASAVELMQEANRIIGEISYDSQNFDLLDAQLDSIIDKIKQLAISEEQVGQLDELLEANRDAPEDVLDELCTILEVDIPRAAEKARGTIDDIAGGQNGPSKQNISILAKQLQEIYNISRQIGDNEIGFAVDVDGAAYFVKSADHIVKVADEASVAVRALNESLTILGHTHPSGGLFSAPDYLSAISQKRSGMNMPVVAVGSNAASLLNLDGVDETTLDQIERVLDRFKDSDNAVGPSVVKELQNILSANGFTDALQVVDISNGMDGLSEALLKLSMNATEVQTPLQKLQSLIQYYSGNKLDADGVSRFTNEWKAFESGAKSAAEVFDSVMYKLGATDLEGNYFRTSEKEYENLSTSLNMIKPSADAAINTISEVENKLKSFFEFADKMQHENLYGSAENNVDIGRYIERLEKAKTELEELGKQGIITAEDLEKVNTAFTEAIIHLEAETSHYDSYYSGPSYDYYDDYKQEQSKNGDLENELTRKDERIAELESDLRSSDDALQETLGNKYALIAESRTLEIERAKLLLQKQNLEYEDILALMQSYQNLQAKAKEAFDYGDEKAMHDMQDLAGQIYDRVVPQNLDDFTEPDRWFKAVGVSAEEGAQKLLEFRERLEAIGSSHNDLILSDSDDIYSVEHLNNILVGEDVRDQYEIEREEINSTISALEAFKQEKLSVNDDGYITSEDGMFYDFDGILEDIRSFGEKYGIEINDIFEKVQQLRLEISQLAYPLDIYSVEHLNNTLVGKDARDQYEIEREEIQQTIRALEMFKTEKLSINSDGYIMSEDGMFYDFDGIIEDIISFGNKYEVAIDDIIDKVKNLRIEISQLTDQTEDDGELSDIQRENGALEDRLEILREIADTYGINISQKDRNRYEDLNTKEMEDGLTSREEDRLSELSDKIDEADSNLLEFEQTYDRITLKLSNGKKVEILPNDDGLRKLYKIADSYDNEYNGFDIEDVIFERKQENAVIEATNNALREQLNIEKQISDEKQQSVNKDITLYDSTDGQLAFFDNILQGAQRAEDQVEKLEDTMERVYALDNQTSMFDGDNISYEQPNIVDESQEIVQLEALKTKLLEVKTAVDAKTRAFEEEYVTVDGVVEAEISALQELSNKLGDIITKIGLVEVSLKNIGNNSIQLNVSDSEEQLESLLTSSDITKEMAELERLQGQIIGVKDAVLSKTKAFVDEGNVVGQVIGKEISALNKLLETINEIIPKVDMLSTKMASIRPVDFTAKNDGDSSSTTESGQKTEDKFKARIGAKKGAMTKYIDELKGVQYITDDTRDKLIGLRDTLDTVKTPKDLDNIISKFEELQTEIGILKSSFEKTGLNDVRNAEKKLLGSFNTLNVDQRLDLREERDVVIQQLKTYENAVLSGQRVEISAIENTTRALREKIEAYQVANKEAKKAGISNSGNASFGSTASINAAAKYNSLTSSAASKQFANSSEVIKALSAYEQKYNHLINMRDEIRSKNVIDESDREAFKIATTECNNYAKALEKIINNSLKLKGSKANADDYMLGADFDYSNVESRKSALADFAKQIYGVDTAATDFKDNWNKVVFAVKNGDGTFTQMTATFTDARNEIVAMAGDTKNIQSAFSSFIEGFRGRVKSLAQYFLATVSIYDVWRVIKQGVQYVRDIDLALTELKKVTDETEESYSRFLQTASKTAGEVGSTVADFVNATADFARLGYNIQQAHDLAKAASIYKNVGDGIEDISTASESIISTMKAFGIEANDAIGIIDRFNEVGNNFAISSTGIGEAMQRSASALYEAGNTIDESIALITGANSVIQNPEQVGTALKTLALRLRGAKVELEEAGEDVDGMAESTSQLQAKLKALTHGKVDIMLNADTFKNTTQILREMAGAWEEMTDIERASALELMGGKRQANILASVIKNFDTVEDVIQTSMDSSGSALAENEKYLSSIQGKIDQFNNSVQTMWMNFIDSDVVKFIIDVVTGLIKLVDTVGLIPTSLAAVAVYFTAIKKNNPVTIFKDLSLSMQQYNNMVRQIESINDLVGPLESIETDVFNAGPVNAYAAAVSNLTAKQQAATLAAQGLNSEQIAAVLGANNLEAANIKLAMSEAGVAQAKQNNSAVTGLQAALSIKQQNLAISQQAQNFLLAHSTDVITKSLLAKGVAQGLIEHKDAVTILKSGMVTSANYTQALSWKALGMAIKSAFLSNPVGMILTLIGVITPLISGLVDLVDTTEKVAEAADEAINKYKETQSTLKSSQKIINEISGDYEKLAKGVDELGNNISLSTSEYERYNEIANQIADMFPTMVKGYTEEGNAIIKNKGNVEALTKAYAELQEQANAELLLDGKDIMQNYRNIMQGNNWSLDNSQSNNIKAAKELENIFKNAESFSFVNFDRENRDNFYDDIVGLLSNAGIERGFWEKNSEYVKRAVTEFPNIVQSIINSWDATANAAISQVKPLVSAYLDTSIGYAGLTSEQKGMIDAIASDFDAEFFNQFGGDSSKMYTAIENIIANIKSADIDKDFSATLDVQTKFNNGELTYDEYIAQINAFIAILDKLQADGILDAETVASLKVFFDFQPTTGTNTNDTLLNSAKELLNDEGDAQVGILTKTDLEIVDKYKEKWLDLYGAQMPLEKLKELIAKVREETKDSGVSNLIDDFDVLQEAFGKLGDAYDDFKDNGIITAEALAEINESFGNTEGFDKYIAVLGDSGSSMDDIKAALSGLATAYLSTSDVLNNLTEENERFIISQLKAFGVTNAEEYIADIRAIQSAMAEQYGIDLSNYATVEAMKKAISAEIYQDILDIEDDEVNALAQKYGIDLSNFATVEQQKTAIALAQARARALADKQSAISTAQQNANAKKNATTVQKGEIKGSGLFGTGLFAGDKLVGKSYEEVYAAYNSGEYDDKSWKDQVKTWLFNTQQAAAREIQGVNYAIEETYKDTIAELDDIEAKYSSLDDYVAQYQPQLSIDASKLGGPDTSSSKSGSDSANEFKETLDWIEIRLEEINEQIDLMNAALENASSYAEKNNIIDSMIGVNKTKMANLTAGIQKYAEYAASLLFNIPAQYRDAARDGAIAISEFVGEADEQTVEAIEKYREWAQKVADLKQELEGVKTELRDLAIQKIDNIQDYGGAKTGIEDNQTEKLQNRVDLDETSGLITSSEYYKAMMENSGKKIEYWKPLLADMQKEFDKAVQSGSIQRGSVEWYEQLAKLYEVQAEIDAATIELEEFQNAINDIYWDNFDQLINRIDYLKDETQSLIDLMDSEDMVVTPETDDGWNSDQVEWTKEGLASLGLYAQQMEIAEYQSKQYAEAIDDLSKDYKDGLYSENEYIEKLEELKSAQYDSIEAYYDAQDAIVELNEARIDSIKEGIEKEIDAYEELIEKQKEQLDAEKDLYDFQKNTTEQQKNISQIERQLAALANDHSLSAAAKRKKLEAELAEAQYELQDTYYNRSVEDKQTALDKELEDFQTEKDAEILKWEEYLANVEQIVSDSLNIVQENAAGIGDTLTEKAEEYNLTISDAILTPWQDGSLAVSDYQTTFDTAMSSTMNQLEALKNKWQEVIDKMAEVGKVNVTAINKENANYAAATKPEPSKPQAQKDPPKTNNKETNATNIKSDQDYYGVALAIWHGDYGWGNGSTRNKNLTSKGFDANKVQEIVNKIGKDGYIHNGTWRGKYYGIKDLAPYHINKFAKGTNSAKKDQWAIIDELGDELQLVPGKNGRLEYVKKGTGIVPADLTKRLVDMAMDPQNMLDENRPAISAPHIINNEINIDCSVGTMVNIEHCDQSTLPDVEKLVNKAFDKHMQTLNNAIRSKVR